MHAEVLNSQGKHSEAEKLQREALEACRRLLGPEHPETLDAMNSVAWTLTLQGKFEGARSLALQALELQQRVLGREHAQTLNTQDTLAQALEGLGRLADARKLRQEVLELSSESDNNRQSFLHGLALNIALTEDAPSDDRQRAVELARRRSSSAPKTANPGEYSELRAP